MSNLNCPNCGAPASKIVEKLGIVICAYCDTSFPVPKWFVQPQPEMGDILLAADFSKKPISGWSVQNEDAWELKSDPEPVLQASKKPSGGVHHLLRSSGWFDNLDASVSVKILKGKPEYVRAALFVRYQAGRGGYGVFLSAQGTYMFGYYQQGNDEALKWQTLMDWSGHSALRDGVGESNRVRVVARDEHFQVYLNGELASIFTHDLLNQGEVRIAIEGTKNSAIEATFSDLQVRALPDDK